jgi:hypothetical protein
MIKRIINFLRFLFLKTLRFEVNPINEHEADTLPERRPELKPHNANLIRVMQKEISWRVSAGFDSRDSIISNAANEALIESDGEGNMNWIYEQATRLTDVTLNFHRQMEASWLHETDCDRLDEAFAELDRNGILVRQNFACCDNCAFNGIWVEIHEAEAQSPNPIIGYVFFHQQDTQDVLSNSRLDLSFGASRSQKEADVKRIGERIVTTLRRHGLTVSWNGSVHQRIRIENLNWQRRRYEQWETEST